MISVNVLLSLLMYIMIPTFYATLHYPSISKVARMHPLSHQSGHKNAGFCK